MTDRGVGRGAALAPESLSKPPRRRVFAVGAAAAVAMACTALLPRGGDAQPAKYMNGEAWKVFLSADGGGETETSWFDRWNTMVQPRIDQLAAIAESEGRETGRSEPFRVSMVGDSTMMQQHGVMCAFLGERAGSRFDPKKNQEECCVDTLPRETEASATQNGSGGGGGGDVGNRGKPALTTNNGDAGGERGAGGSGEGGGEGGAVAGGRGVCFRHVYQRFAEMPEEEKLASPDVVYFGSGLHFLHMCRPGHGLEPPKVRGWLNYERNLKKAVEAYRSAGRETFRLIFMTSHTIEESKYEGAFLDLVVAYRNNDTETITQCERQVKLVSGDDEGPAGYERDMYCRRALMDRNGSEVLNRRSRPVMANLGVPLVEGDLIVKDQGWATSRQDGRHYHMLVPTEVWELLGVLVSPYTHATTAQSP